MLSIDTIRKQSTPVTIKCKDLIKHLPQNEQNGIHQLIEASRLTSSIFVAQASHDGPAAIEAAAQELEHAKEVHDSTKCQEIEEILYLLNLFGKPYAAISQMNFLPGKTGMTPPEAAFYPPGTIKEQLDAYISAHPDQEASLLAIDTVVESDGQGGYLAVPFSQKYYQYVSPMCDHLDSAADFFEATQPEFAHFLRERSDALRHNKDLYSTDVEWMNLPHTCPIDITIGPIETYDDQLMGAKASYQSVIFIEAPAAMEKLQRFRHLMDQMEMALPLATQWLRTKGMSAGSSAASTESTTDTRIELYNVVYLGGAAATPPFTIAHNLPNDERITAAYGNRNQFYLNILKAKMEYVLMPIANVIVGKDYQKYVNAESFLTQVLLHELSHTLGPSYVHNDPKISTIHRSLGAVDSSIEECKADTLSFFFGDCVATGAVKEHKDYSAPLISKEDMKYFYITTFASLFRSIRFGRSSAHGVGCTVQLNWLLANKAAIPPPPGTLGFSFDFERFPDAIRSLATELLEIKLHGDKARAERLIREYGTDVPPVVTEHLKAIQDLPFDLDVTFDTNLD